MRTRISKWGNSAGLRLPKSILELSGFEEGQEVELIVHPQGLDIRSAGRSVSLADLVAEAKRLGPQNAPAYEDWGILPSEWPVEDWSDIAPKGALNAGNKRKTAGRR